MYIQFTQAIYHRKQMCLFNWVALPQKCVSSCLFNWVCSPNWMTSIETGKIRKKKNWVGSPFSSISDCDTYARTPADANCRRKKNKKNMSVSVHTAKHHPAAKLCQLLKLLTGRPGETLTPTAVTLRPGAVARRAYLVQSDNMVMWKGKTRGGLKMGLGRIHLEMFIDFSLSHYRESNTQSEKHWYAINMLGLHNLTLYSANTPDRYCET